MANLLFLFAPGVGAPSSHPWIAHWACLLRNIGKVRTLDYPYMLEHRKRPDRLSTLIAPHRAAVAKVQRNHGGQIVMIGKSMGSRVGCHVALEEKVKAVVCLGYPLCGSGYCDKMRDEVLLKLTTPILFVSRHPGSFVPTRSTGIDPFANESNQQVRGGGRRRSFAYGRETYVEVPEGNSNRY